MEVLNAKSLLSYRHLPFGYDLLEVGRKMIFDLISLVSSYVTLDVCELFVYPLFCLYFIGTIPVFGKFLLR